MIADIITYLQIIFAWMLRHWFVSALIWFCVLLFIVTIISMRNAPIIDDDKEI